MSNNLNPEFNELIQRFEDEWKTLAASETLEQVEESITNVESSKIELIDWVLDNIEDEEEQGNYFGVFGQTEIDVEENFGGIPTFDGNFDVYDSFDSYEGYYQRYGCMTPDFVVSWDGENILFSDDYGEVEMIKRPDVLMGESD